MESLTINKFKAFEDSFEILTNGQKNLLLCGENGAGKSSIFDALRYVFYHERMINAGIEPGDTPEEKSAKMQQNEESYVNKKHAGEAIEIKFNGSDCRTLTYDDYEVYMISPEDIRHKNVVNLRDILYKAYVTHKSAEVFLAGYTEDTIRLVNDALTNRFGENIHLEITDGYNCKLVGDGGLISRDNLTKYFNEAKLTIVFLLIIFSYIKASSNANKKRILVLDDIVTSLDVAYRISLIKYVMEEFDGFQKIILTHSPTFYNLFAYVINKDQRKAQLWKFCQLYAIEGKHALNDKKEFSEAAKYRRDWMDTLDDDRIGNDVRQYVEVLATELNSLYHLTAHEGTRAIIDSLARDKREQVYLCLNSDGTFKTVIDMVKEIEIELINIANVPSERCNRCKAIIDEYKTFDEFKHIKDIFQDIDLYQKVILHPASHGAVGLRHFTSNEVLYSIALAERMEKLIDVMRRYNNSGDVYSY